MVGIASNLAINIVKFIVVCRLRACHVGCVPAVLHSSRLAPQDRLFGVRPYNPLFGALGLDTASASVAPVVDDHLVYRFGQRRRQQNVGHRCC